MSGTWCSTMSSRPRQASLRECFEAAARSLRELLVPRWLQTDTTSAQANPKQVYALSTEFLIGHSLTN
jgi:starch phosphorylase